jgi:serine/threonine-protein kinase HipA
MPLRLGALDIWMNGFYVGRWERAGVAGGADRLTYDPAWMAAPEGRPLSLSLPFSRGHGDRPVALRGQAVAAYFENLIPDNERILRRLRDRYGAASTSAFDLLSALGRDCAGAVQLVPAGEGPGDAQRIDAQPLDESDVAQLLRNATVSGPLSAEESEAFRLSIAGAQEKTALLWHEGRWCIPHGATPSTHIFKLPMGLVGNMRADLRDSVELEWLSMELARELGLPVAKVEIGYFEDQKALIVERFDRRLSADGRWWQRIPQEDLCQALGLPPSRKYEADRGPGIRQVMELLRGSEHAEADRETFFKAQLVFWMLAATDGHAKNFSLHLRPGGAYRLTPLYDVLSIYPMLGSGAGKVDPRKAKLAMALEGKNRHYVLHDIHRWHWVAMAERLGLHGAPDALIKLSGELPSAIERVANRLPAGFPEALFNEVAVGARNAAQRLATEPDRRA